MQSQIPRKVLVLGKSLFEAIVYSVGTKQLKHFTRKRNEITEGKVKHENETNALQKRAVKRVD